MNREKNRIVLALYISLFVWCLLYVSSYYDRMSFICLIRNSLEVEKVQGQLRGVLHDSLRFPVQKNGKVSYNYEDGFGDARTFGGNRRHEGIDIISSKNTPGCLQVVSMSDGIVEKIGWLTLGGYRVGIRSKNGIYYYYAHLAKYRKGLKRGVTIHAGEPIGWMGNTGYGKKGTKGKFVVHLHFGVYLADKKGRERAIDPYDLLRYIQWRNSFFFGT